MVTPPAPVSPEAPAAGEPAPPASTAVAAVAQAGQTMAQTTQVAAHAVADATRHAQATVQQVAQQATVSPRRAVYRGRHFAAGFAVALAALAFLAALARRYHILPGDVGVARLIQNVDGAAYDWLMKLVSELGWQWPSVLMRLTATAVSWNAGFRLEGAFIAATWSGDLLTMIIKDTVGRPRPTRRLVRVTYLLGEHSFPSGHVVHYVTFYGFLFYLLWSHLKQGAWRTLVLTLLAGLVLLIGPSRVYQGAHWPSDVSGAYLVGSLWLSVLIVAYLETKARFQLVTAWPFLQHRARTL